MTIRTIIVDDEPLARRGVRQLLRSHADIEVVAECADGFTAVEKTVSLRPDLLLLDVQMPGMDGFEALDLIFTAHRPLVVFLTAYDEYAVKAFRIHALDYLLKPIVESDFDQAIERVRARIGADVESEERLAAVLDHANLRAASRYQQRLLVRQRRRMLIVPVSDVHAFCAAGNYVRVLMDRGTYLVRDTMDHLETRLDPARFLRIHRQSIVSLDRIEEIEPDTGSGYAVILQQGVRLPVGRKYRDSLLRIRA